jgi:hypothetical protein
LLPCEKFAPEDSPCSVFNRPRFVRFDLREGGSIIHPFIGIKRFLEIIVVFDFDFKNISEGTVFLCCNTSQDGHGPFGSGRFGSGRFKVSFNSCRCYYYYYSIIDMTTVGWNGFFKDNL